MGKNAKTKLRGRELAVRLVGISTPVGGIDWEPPAEEREKAKQVLKYLARRSARHAGGLSRVLG
jgi:hypothetical protein